MLDKAVCILSNYQMTKSNMPFRGSGPESGLTFIQRGGQGGRGRGGRGRGTGRGEIMSGGEANAGGGGGDVSTMT